MDHRPYHHPLLHRLPQSLPYCDGPINLFSLPSLGKGFPYQKGIKRGSIGNTSLVSKNVIAAYLHINVISPGKNIFLLSVEHLLLRDKGHIVVISQQAGPLVNQVQSPLRIQ